MDNLLLDGLYLTGTLRGFIDVTNCKLVQLKSVRVFGVFKLPLCTQLILTSHKQPSLVLYASLLLTRLL
jgi:hypothetical protein